MARGHSIGSPGSGGRSERDRLGSKPAGCDQVRGGIVMTAARRRRQAGFMIAPILYVLTLAGVGAAVLFSGYSQILRTNIEITRNNTAKNDLQAAARTLSASSVLMNGGLNIQPPAELPFAGVPAADISKLPAGFNNVGSTGMPTTLGTLTSTAGAKQLDPWNRFYIYCRWENATNPGNDPALLIISAGPDGTLDTKCGDTTAQNDDISSLLSVANAIDRANVWQYQNSGNPTVQFGISTNAVKATDAGDLTANSLALAGGLSAASVALTSPLPVASGGTGAASASSARSNLGSGTTGDALFTASTAAGARTTLGATATGDAVFTAADAPAARSVLGASAVGDALFTAADASAGRTALGAGATGSSLFTSGTAAAARTALGATSVGDSVFTAASATSARTILGAGAIGDVLFQAPDETTALTALGLVGGGGTLDVSITGSAATATTATNLASGANILAGAVPVNRGGTGAQTAAAARSNLGTDDAGNLTSGTLDWNRLPDSGVIAGAYSWGTVNAKGIVTSANSSTSNVLGQNDSDITITDSTAGAGTDAQIAFTLEGTTYALMDDQGYFGLGTLTPQDRLHVKDGAMRIEGAVASERLFKITTGNALRWDFGADSSAESGSDAGSDFVLRNYDDTGVVLGTPFSIDRATGNAVFNGTVTAAGFSGGGLSTVALSGLTAAAGTNTIANANYAQAWNWDTLTTQNAMVLGSTSITSGKILSIPSSATGFTGTMADIILSGNNAANTGTLLKTTVSGASSAAVPLMVTNLGAGLSFRVNDATGDTDTTPFVVDASGNVGIGVAAPGTKLEVLNAINVLGDGTVAPYISAYDGLNLTYIGLSAQLNSGTIEVFRPGDSLKPLNIYTTGVSIGSYSPLFTHFLSLDGDAARAVGMERHTTADTAGNALSVLAGGATVGATDKDGGALTLKSGIATGDGSSSILFQTVQIGQGTGTTDRSPATSMILASNALTLPTGATTAQPGQSGMQAATAGMIRYNTTTNAFEGYAGSSPAWGSLAAGGAASNVPLSGLTAATATNTIANANYAQAWNWDTLTTQNAMALGSTSITSGKLLSLASSATGFTGTMTDIVLSGNNAANTGTLLKTTVSGASSVAVPLMVTNLGAGLSFRVNDATGDTDTTPFVVDENGSVGIATATPSYILSLGGNAARTIGMERSATGGAAGSNLSIGAGGTAFGNTDQDGGSLLLKSGTATGNGASSILFQTVQIGQGTGTTDRFVATAMTLASNALTLPTGATTTQPGQSGMQAAAAGMIRYNTDATPNDKVEYYDAESTSWVQLSGGTAANTPLSGLTAATTINTIANANYAQAWNWDTLTTETAMAFGSTSITSGKILSLASSATGFTGTMANIALSGNNAANTGTLLKSSVSGASSAAVPLMVTNLGAGLSLRINDETGDADATPVVVNAAGNLGVGTATPAYVLDIVNPGTGVGNSAYDTVRIGNAFSQGYANIIFVNTSSAYKGSIGYANTSANPYNNTMHLISGSGIDLTFNTDEDSNGSGVERVRIKASTGFTGIGTVAPEALLEVQGTEGADAGFALDADDGDDNADTWFIKSLASGNSLSFINHATEVMNVEATRKFIVAPPSSQTIADTNTIAADACGTIKPVTSAGSVTTNTTDTFTAPTASYNGCCMDVVNVGSNDIILDVNAKFVTASGSNVTLAASDALRVCATASVWYQTEDKVSGGTASNVPLSGLTAATATNTIANANYAQAWNWDTLTTETAMALGSTSITSGKILSLTSSATGFTGTMASIALSGNNAANTGTLLKSSVSGASSAAVPLMVTNLGAGLSLRINDETGDADTSPFVIGATGNVGIGTAAPATQLHIVENAASDDYMQIVNSSTNTVLSVINDSDYVRLALNDSAGDNRITMYSWSSAGPYIDINPSGSALEDAAGLSSYGAGLRIGFPNVTGEENGIGFSDTLNYTAAAITAYDPDGANYGKGGLKLKTSDDMDLLTTRMKIDETGRVGIGIDVSTSASTIAEALLEVQGAEGADATFALDADDGDDNADTWFIKSLATGNSLSFINHSTEVMNAEATRKFIVAPPSSQTIADTNTIAADACGTIKPVTSAGSVTTNTTDTFTAPAASYNGCCMDVVNVGSNNIILDVNAKFVTASGSNVTLGASDAVRVCATSAVWYQTEDKMSGGTAANVPLSGLTAATATNTIANENYAQAWNWDTLTTETAMALGSTSVTSGKILSLASSATGFTGTMADIVLSGNNAANTGTLLKSSVSGASSAAVPLMATNLGTGLSFRVNDETGDTDTTPFVVDASGNVGVGTAVPVERFEIVSATSGTSGYLTHTNYEDTASWHAPVLQLRRAGGTPSAPDSVGFGNELGRIEFTGYEDSVGSWITGASIVGFASGSAFNSMPASLGFFTNAGGAITTGRMIISAAGNVGIGFAFNEPEALLEVQSAEGTDATFALDADDGDDNADTWFIKSLATGNSLSFINHSTEVMNAEATRKFIVAPPSSQTIADTNTITADACGTIKPVTSAGSVTTNTTDTFTAPAAAYNGCCMDVVNVGSNDIILDVNAKFVTASASNVTLGASDAVRVCATASVWYQTEDKMSGGTASNVPLSGLTAATATNTIANANYAQAWNWDTLTTETAMALGSTSITSGKILSLASSATGFTGTMANIALSGNNAANTGTLLKTTVSGALSAAVPLMATNLGTGASFRVNDETGDTDSTPFIIDSAGNVGINEDVPLARLHITHYYPPTHQAFLIQDQYHLGNGTSTAVEHSAGPDYSAAISVVGAWGRGDTVPAFAAATGALNTGLAFGFMGMAMGSSTYDSANPAAVSSGDYLPGLAFAGQSTLLSGGGMVIGAAINGVVNGTVGSGVVPMDIVFRTSVDNSDNLTEYMRLTSGGKLSLFGGSSPSYDVSMNGTGAARTIGMEREATAATAGRALSINAGGAKSGGTNLAGGDLTLKSGIATGNGASSILFQTVQIGQGTGTTDRSPATSMTLASNALTIPTGATTAQPGQSGMQAAAAGMIRYNTTATPNDKVEYYDAESAAWIQLAGSGSAGALSGLTAATGTNTIANVSYAQAWNWDSLTTETAMALGSTSITSGKILSLASSATGFTGTMANIVLSGNNAANTGTLLKSSVSGASSAAVPLMVTNLGAGISFRVNDETGDTDSTPFVVDASGNVGIGTAAPTVPFEIAANAANQDHMAITNDSATEIFALYSHWSGAEAKFSDALGVGRIGFYTDYNSGPYIDVTPYGSALLDGTSSSLGSGLRIGFPNGTGEENGISFNDDVSYTAAAITAYDADNLSGSVGGLKFKTANGANTLATRMTITETGVVGIGTMAPEALLEVQGAEGADATFALDADEGDDNADTWFIKSLASGNSLSFINNATEVMNAEATRKFIVAPPSSEAIAAAAVITANACGTIKTITSTGNVTTNTTDTFTSATASYNGCCMDIINVDTADTITLDDNTKFLTAGGADIALAPNDMVRVCSNGTNWYQAEDKVTSGGGGAVDGLSDAETDYATDFNMYLGSEFLPPAGAQYNLGLGQNAANSITTGSWNLGIGHNALTANETGYGNTAIGPGALAVPSAFHDNTAVGDRAGQNILGNENVAVGSAALAGSGGAGGDYNVAIGASAMRYSAGGSNIAIGTATLAVATAPIYDNVAIGTYSQYSNDSGEGNIAIGDSSLRLNISGSGSVAIGDEALFNAIGGTNTALGYHAGDGITTGAGNIVIGYDVDAPAAGTSNHLNIGGTVFGDLATDNVRIGGSGAVSASSNLEVSGTLAVKLPSGTNAQRPGTAGGTTAAGGMLRYNTDATPNDKVEYYDAESTSWIQLASAGVAGALSGLTAAAGTNTIANENYAQAWNWDTLTTETAMALGSTSITSGKILNLTSSSVGMTGTMANFVLSGSHAGNTGTVLKTSMTGTTGTAVPLMVTNLGTGLSFRINDETGDADATPFVVSAAGDVGIGTTAPEALLEAQGVEGADAGFALDADEGDDNADTWFIKSLATGNSLSFINHATEVMNAEATRKFIVAPPSSQTIADTNTITADACGTIKPVTSAGSVTTNTTDTFTAPSASYNGCCMDVVNVGSNDIILDVNAKFVTASASNVTLGASDAVRVCATASVWYQTEDKVSGGGGAALSGITAATTTNTIANENYAQAWNWDTLTTETAMALGSTSITSGKILSLTSSATGFTGTMASIALSGNNAANTGTLLKSSVSGASSAAVPLMVTNLGAGLSLRVNDETGDTDATPFVIDNAGNVGIGMTAPASQIDMTANDLNQDHIKITSSVANEIFLLSSHWGAAEMTLSDDAGDTRIIMRAADLNGPYLDIEPESSRLEDGVANSVSAIRIGIPNETGGENGIAFSNIDYSVSPLAAITGYDGDGNISNYVGGLKFKTANGANTLATRMTITETGVVGIGTTAPESLLEVQGAEGADAGFTLDADEGDDNADTWFIKSLASGNTLSFINHSTEVMNAEATRKFIVAPPSSQTIADTNTIAADACGTIKPVTSAGSVTTNTTDTFTAPSASYNGCCMDVVNVGSNDIILDVNAKFVTASGSNVTLGASDAVRVCATSAVWYQTEDKVSGGGAALSGLTAATATNTIANANYAQAWNWDTLTTETALALGSTSITSGKILSIPSSATAFTGTMADIVLSGSNAANTGTVLKSSVTGASSVAVPLMVTNLGAGISFRVNDETSDSDSTPLVVDLSGNIGVGTATPSAKVHVVGQIASIRYALTDGATVAVDWNNGNVQSVTLGGNRTFTFANPVDGARYVLIIKQDGTGSRTATWPATVRWPGGSAPTLTTTAAKTDYIAFIYNGVDSKYDAVAISQNY